MAVPPPPRGYELISHIGFIALKFTLGSLPASEILGMSRSIKILWCQFYSWTAQGALHSFHIWDIHGNIICGWTGRVAKGLTLPDGSWRFAWSFWPVKDHHWLSWLSHRKSFCEKVNGDRSSSRSVMDGHQFGEPLWISCIGQPSTGYHI